MGVTGSYVFPCGALIRGERGDMPLSARGRVRLIVFGSDGQRPKHGGGDGAEARCMTDCPKRHARRIQRGWLGDDAARPRANNITTHATCLATWVPGSERTRKP